MVLNPNGYAIEMRCPRAYILDIVQDGVGLRFEVAVHSTLKMVRNIH